MCSLARLKYGQVVSTDVFDRIAKVMLNVNYEMYCRARRGRGRNVSHELLSAWQIYCFSCYLELESVVGCLICSGKVFQSWGALYGNDICDMDSLNGGR